MSRILTKEEWDAGCYGTYEDLNTGVQMTRYPGILGPCVDRSDFEPDYAVNLGEWTEHSFIGTLLNLILSLMLILLQLSPLIIFPAIGIWLLIETS